LRFHRFCFIPDLCISKPIKLEFEDQIEPFLMSFQRVTSGKISSPFGVKSIPNILGGSLLTFLIAHPSPPPNFFLPFGLKYCIFYTIDKASKNGEYSKGRGQSEKQVMMKLDFRTFKPHLTTNL
jgi:hypothetical protein